VEHPQITRLAQSGAAPGGRSQLQGCARGRGSLAGAQRQSRSSPRCTTAPDASPRLRRLRRAGTYVIDRKGVIRYKRIGPVTPEILKEKIEPLLRELNV
jgi:hypothetical protein